MHAGVCCLKVSTTRGNNDASRINQNFTENTCHNFHNFQNIQIFPNFNHLSFNTSWIIKSAFWTIKHYQSSQLYLVCFLQNMIMQMSIQSRLEPEPCASVALIFSEIFARSLKSLKSLKTQVTNQTAGIFKHYVNELHLHNLCNKPLPVFAKISKIMYSWNYF